MTRARRRLTLSLARRRMSYSEGGAVYRAIDPLIEREVAIKKMLPHLSEDRAFIDMMVKEAKLTVLLHHPNIVDLYEVLDLPDGVYVVYEYNSARSIREILKETLEAYGYRVLTAKDGAEGVNVAKAELPDLILMDVVMPKKTGFEACRELRRQEATRTIPIIMVTTRGEGENVE